MSDHVHNEYCFKEHYGCAAAEGMKRCAKCGMFDWEHNSLNGVPPLGHWFVDAAELGRRILDAAAPGWREVGKR